MNKKKDYEKVAYEIDPYNRLIVEKTNKKSPKEVQVQIRNCNIRYTKNNNG